MGVLIHKVIKHFFKFCVRIKVINISICPWICFRSVSADKLAYISGLDAEAARITDKAKAEKKKLAGLEDFILLIHRKSGKDKSIAGSWTVGTRKSVQVRIIDPDFNDQRFFVIKQTSQLDKIKLKDALKNGEDVPGAELVTNYNLSVK